MLTPGIPLPLRRRQGGGGCATRCDTSRGLPREVLPLRSVGCARSALFQRNVYLREIRGGGIGAEGHLTFTIFFNIWRLIKYFFCSVFISCPHKTFITTYKFFEVMSEVPITESFGI